MVTFGNEVKKIQKYYVIFAYVLQGKMGKISKTKRQKYGMNETIVYIGVFIVIELFSVYLGHLSFRWAPQRKFTQSDLMKMLKLEKATLPKLG